MRRHRVVVYVLAVLVAFIFSSGFLGVCMGPGYIPCSFVLFSKCDVEPEGRENVWISGIVESGSQKYGMTTVDGEYFPVKESGDFDCLVDIKPGAIYSVYTFAVLDRLSICNKERYSVAVGQPCDPRRKDSEGNFRSVNDAVGVRFTDGLMNELEEIIPHLLKPMIAEALASGLPMSRSLGGDSGDLVITGIEIGDINLFIDIQDGDRISVGMDIIAPPEGGDALLVQGRHERTGSLPDVDVNLKTGWVEIRDGSMRLAADDDGVITATLDLDGAGIDLHNPDVTCGDQTVPPWLIDTVSAMFGDFLDDVLGGLVLPVLDRRGLTPPGEGIDVTTWLMQQDPVFSSRENSLAIDMGVNARAVESVNWRCNHFRSTPHDALPLVTTSGDENLMVAINDDMINEFALALIRSNAFVAMDMSDAVAGPLGRLGKGLNAVVTLITPPVADFSGELQGIRADAADFGSPLPSDCGRLLIPDIVIEINAPTLSGRRYSARLSVDVDAAFRFGLSEDGRRLKAVMDDKLSDSRVFVLYDNTTNAALLPDIGFALANGVVDVILDRLVDITIPFSGWEGVNLDISLVGGEMVSANNSFVAKLRVENAMAEE